MTKEIDQLKKLLTGLNKSKPAVNTDPYFTVFASTAKKSTPYGMEIREALKTQETKEVDKLKKLLTALRRKPAVNPVIATDTKKLQCYIRSSSNHQLITIGNGGVNERDK